MIQGQVIQGLVPGLRVVTGHLHTLHVEEAAVADEVASALAAGQPGVVDIHQPQLLGDFLLHMM
jgi:hypothetical protein